MIRNPPTSRRPLIAAANAARASACSPLEAADFALFRDYLRQACGIHLAENKQYLVESRIRRILLDQGLAKLSELVLQLREARNPVLASQVIDAMTTNETYWFRDSHPFELLRRDVLPQLMGAPGEVPVRVWSAACSSGQEPYSISMIADELLRANSDRGSRPLQIVATDVCDTVLAQARAAEYDQYSISRGLSEAQIQHCFEPLPDCGRWRLKDELRRSVEVRSLNLLDSYSGLGKFDLILCRNVLIYFDTNLKQDILRRLHAALKPNGLLFLGASEGIANVSDLFEMIHANPGIYYRAR